MANFTPPGNGVSQGNFFLQKSHKLGVLMKNRLTKTVVVDKLTNISGSKFEIDRQTDRQTDRFFDTI